MQIRYHNSHESRSSHVAEVDGDELTIGQSPDCDLVVRSPYLSPVAARLRLTDGRWQLAVTNENGASVDGQLVVSGASLPISERSTFHLFPFEFSLDPDDTRDSGEDEIWQQLESRSVELLRTLHVRLLEHMHPTSTATENLTAESLLLLERNLEVLARDAGIASHENRDLVVHLAGHCLRSELIDETLRYVDPQLSRSAFSEQSLWSQLHSGNPARERDLQRLRRALEGRLQLAPPRQLTQRMQQLDTGFRRAWKQTVPSILDDVLLYLCQRQLKKQIKDIVFGYGPLEDLLRLPTITEVMVIGSDRIFVERNGVIENSGRRFVSEAVTLSIIERIVSLVGRRIDKSQPVADARLSDGSRVNAVIAPVALDGPLLTVRKFPTRRLTVAELTGDLGSLTSQTVAFLQACVAGRCNILISGGTGTGKTTLLNCLADFIPVKERIVTIEDTAELQIERAHVARMETRPANVEGQGALDIADLVRNALRMRPDRIVIGECRGREALWMLQAMNTGHDGSLTTIHANSARDVVLRLEVMVQSAADLPVESIHRQISSAVDVIVQLERLPCGRRVVSEIAEVLPPAAQTTGVRIRQLFHRDPDAGLVPTGLMPSFLPELLEKQLLQPETFYV
jgi:pilus assembly protein CpaF